MNRWSSIFLLHCFIYITSAEEQEDATLLTRPIHQRRHKRNGQGHMTVQSKSPFVLWQNDPKCMIPGRDMMSCPKKNADDPHEKLICIEPSALCDEYQDCNGAEDEDAQFCMFKKLEDAEMRRIKAEILILLQNNRKQQQPDFTDIIVNSDATSNAAIKQASRPGVFKISGLGPLTKTKMYMNDNDDDVNKSVENSEESEEEESKEDDEEEQDREDERIRQEEAVSEHAKRKRVYRHLLQLKQFNS